jgi:hypothetical protein
MNAIISLITWILAQFGSPSAPATVKVDEARHFVKPHDLNNHHFGVHIMNGNPRTVVALEDTHFRPM